MARQNLPWCIILQVPQNPGLPQITRKRAEIVLEMVVSMRYTTNYENGNCSDHESKGKKEVPEFEHVRIEFERVDTYTITMPPSSSIY